MAEPKRATPAKAESKAQARMESFEVSRPDGSLVRVTRNIDTGEQTVTDVDQK